MIRAALAATVLLASGGGASAGDWATARAQIWFEDGPTTSLDNAPRLTAAKLAADRLREGSLAERLEADLAVMDLIAIEEERHGFSDTDLIVQTCARILVDADAARAAPQRTENLLALAHAALVADNLISIDCGGEARAKSWMEAARAGARRLPAGDPAGVRVAAAAAALSGVFADMRTAGEAWAAAFGEADPGGLYLRAYGLWGPGRPDPGSETAKRTFAEADRLIAQASAAHGANAAITVDLELQRALRRGEVAVCQAEIDAIMGRVEGAVGRLSVIYGDALKAWLACTAGGHGPFASRADEAAYHRKLYGQRRASLGPAAPKTFDAFLRLHWFLVSDLKQLGTADAEARRLLREAVAAAPTDPGPGRFALSLSSATKDSPDLALRYLLVGLDLLSRSEAVSSVELAQLISERGGELLKGGRELEVIELATQALERKTSELAIALQHPDLLFLRAQAHAALGRETEALADLDRAVATIDANRALTREVADEIDEGRALILVLTAALRKDKATAKAALASAKLWNDLIAARAAGGDRLVLALVETQRLAGRAPAAQRLSDELARGLADQSLRWSPDVRSDAPFGSALQRGFLRGEVHRRLQAGPVRLTETGSCAVDGNDMLVEDETWSDPCVFAAVGFRLLQATTENPAGRTLAQARAAAGPDQRARRDLARRIVDLRGKADAAARLGDRKAAEALLDERLALETAYDALPEGAAPVPQPARLKEALAGLQGDEWKIGDPVALANLRAEKKGYQPRVLLALFDSPAGYIAYLLRYEPFDGKSYALARTLDLSRDAAAELVRRTGGRLAFDLPAASYPAQIKPYDVAAAHALHQAILAPFAKDLEGVEELTLYLEGPLAEQPAHLMITALNGADTLEGPERYRAARWLAETYRLRTTPSITAFAQPRRGAGAASTRALIVADPILGGPGSRISAAIPSMDTLGGAADVDEIRALPRLVQTETIAKALARGIDEAEMVLGADATETRVRSLAASGGRLAMIAFATHGLGRDELAHFKLAEPALVLTPPDVAGDTMEDGLLTQSEIASLNLGADWVLLVACNTAAPDAKGRGGALSGLAEAFFFSGARSVLASYWPVEVNATEALMEHLAADPSATPAERLRAAMAAVRNDEKNPQWAHPAMWAPFVLVGD